MQSASSLRGASMVRDEFMEELGIEESPKEEQGRPPKRFKSSAPFNESSIENNEFSTPPSLQEALFESRPLGLRLSKSPSLLAMIQMRLCQDNVSSVGSASSGNINLRSKEDVKFTPVSANSNKLKASNFPASLLQVGHWEFVSKYEGDLVAKYYFSKRKIVWEMLEGGLKSKIEIHWSNIMFLKANYPDDGPAILTIMLAKPPLFYKETNPQPRKHAIWKVVDDFTDGQAGMHRQHVLHCSRGHLSKHYQKLVTSDKHLNLVNQQPGMALVSHFKEQSSVAQLCSLSIEEQNHLSPEAPSCGLDLHGIEGNGNHGFKALNDIAQILMSDAQFRTTPSDEKTLMAKVNSLCRLLHDPEEDRN